ncbi:MAG: efflux RND transporter periplasmic adaptor subunit [Alphaproteobacteria bacterium]
MKSSHWIALAVAVLAVAWIASGQLDGSDATPAATAERTATTDGEQAPGVAPRVRVRALIAQDRSREILVNGRTEASRSVVLRTETKGRVVEVGATRGAPVKAGSVIVRLAMNDRADRLREAKAIVAQRDIKYRAARKLAKKGFRSEVTLAEEEARLETARATLARIRLDIANTRVRAPFDGVLQSRDAEIGYFLDFGKPVATFVDLDPIRVVASVTEREVALVHPDMTADARLVTGETIAGRITYVSPAADPATRTFRVEMEAANPGNRLADGITSALRITVNDSAKAHFVTPALLTLDADGRIGVVSVDATNIARFLPATIVGDTAEGVWLSGLPDRLTIITVGQETVNDGQRVAPVPEAAATPAAIAGKPS